MKDAEEETEGEVHGESVCNNFGGSVTVWVAYVYIHCAMLKKN